MSGEAIALAKHLDIKKLEFPVWFSEKLDGVPVRFKISYEAGGWIGRAYTRQWEHAISCQYYCNKFIQFNCERMNPAYEFNLVFEVTHETLTGFKDISGVVRRQSHQPGLVFNLFDFDSFPRGWENSGKGFGDRMNAALRDWTLPHEFRTIHQVLYPDAESLQDALDNTPIADTQEGWVLRSHNALWKPGTRHWDYQKVVKEPTIDLRVVGMMEGVGKNAGGAGTLIAIYKGGLIGVGIGKTSYDERKVLWQQTDTIWLNAVDISGKKFSYRAFMDENGEVKPRMACIKHKPDDTYDALRQPTFQHWRDDKKVPDA